MLKQGRELLSDGREDEAFAVWDEVVTRYGESAEPALRLSVAVALKLRDDRLKAVGRYLDAIVMFERLGALFGGDGESEKVTALVALALIARALSLDKLDRHDDEIATYDLLIGRYQGSDAMDVRSHVVTRCVSRR